MCRGLGREGALIPDADQSVRLTILELYVRSVEGATEIAWERNMVRMVGFRPITHTHTHTNHRFVIFAEDQRPVSGVDHAPEVERRQSFAADGEVCGNDLSFGVVRLTHS